MTNGWPQPGGGVGKQRLEDTRGSTTEQSLTVTGCKSLGEAPPQETLAAEEGFLEAGLGPRVGGISAADRGWEPHLRNMAAI